MKTQTFFCRWRRRYLKLLHKQWMVLRQSRREGAPGQVHELRVTLRRLRLLIRLGEPLINKAVAGEYRRWSRVISTATSRLRDCDVTLEWLKGQSGAEEIVEDLQVRRDRLWRIQKPRLTAPTAKIRSRLSHIEAPRKNAARLRKRFLKRFDRLQSETFESIPNFFELSLEDRHAFRRSLRRLRYLRELALSRKKQASDALLKGLIRPQVAMGEFQNLVVAEEIIGHLKETPTSARLVGILRKQRTSWQSEIRRGLRALAEMDDRPAGPGSNAGS